MPTHGPIRTEPGLFHYEATFKATPEAPGHRCQTGATRANFRATLALKQHACPGAFDSDPRDHCIA